MLVLADEDKTLHGIEEKPMKELSAPFVRECTNVCGEQINAIPLFVFMVMMMVAMLTKGCDFIPLLVLMVMMMVAMLTKGCDVIPLLVLRKIMMRMTRA